MHPNVVGLVYVAAHAPDVGENERALDEGKPSFTQKQAGAIKVVSALNKAVQNRLSASCGQHELTICDNNAIHHLFNPPR